MAHKSHLVDYIPTVPSLSNNAPISDIVDGHHPGDQAAVTEAPKSARFRDACGRLIDPLVQYVWTEISVKGTFGGAVSSGYLPDSEILAFVWFGANPVLCALIANVKTHLIAVYRINPETARPVVVVEFTGKVPIAGATRGDESPVPRTNHQPSFDQSCRNAILGGEAFPVAEDGCLQSLVPDAEA